MVDVFAVLRQNAFETTSPFTYDWRLRDFLPRLAAIYQLSNIHEAFCCSDRSWTTSIFPSFETQAQLLLLILFSSLSRLLVLNISYILCWNSRSSRWKRNPGCWLSPGSATLCYKLDEIRVRMFRTKGRCSVRKMVQTVSVVYQAPFTRYNLCCIVYTNIQPVVKPVSQPAWQPAVSCIQSVVKPVVSLQSGLITGWTNSGCLFNTVVETGLTRIGLAAGIVSSLHQVWKAEVSKSTKVLLYKTLVPSIILYSETCVQKDKNSSEDEIANVNFLLHSCRWKFTYILKHFTQCGAKATEFGEKNAE